MKGHMYYGHIFLIISLNTLFKKSLWLITCNISGVLLKILFIVMFIINLSDLTESNFKQMNWANDSEWSKIATTWHTYR